MPTVKRDIKFLFLGDATKLTKASQQAQKSLGGVDKSAQKNQTAFSGLAQAAKNLGPVLGAGALVAGVRSAVDRAEEMASQYAITEQIIETTGGAAGVTGEQVKGMAKEMSLVTGIDKSVATEAANVLLTFTNLTDTVGEGNQVFSETLGLTADMATVFGGSAKDAAKQLGKALNDPVANLGALSRAGVTFSDSQKEMIRDLVETGDLLGAQKVILKELERQFGGTAEASADATDKIMNQWKEVQEELGTKLLPVLENVSDAFNDLRTIEDTIRGIGSSADGAAGGVGNFVVSFAEMANPIGFLFKTQELIRGAREELELTENQIDATTARWEGLAAVDFDWRDDISDATQAEAELADQALITVAALHAQEDQTDDTAKSTAELADEINALADPFFAAVDAADDYAQALQDANEDGEITRDEALGLGQDLGRLRAQFEKFRNTSGSYEAAMGLMQDATGLTRRQIEDLIDTGETFDGSNWNAEVSVDVSRADFDKLLRMSSDLSAAATRGIPLDFSGIRLATPAQIERAVVGAIQTLIRRGVVRNVYL